MQSSPDTLQWGWQGVYNTSTAYWANRRVLNLAQLKFSYILPVIQQLQNTLESGSVELVGGVLSKFSPMSAVNASKDTRNSFISAADLSAIQEIFAANAWKATFEMNRLLQYLFFTYPDGSRNYWDEGGFHSVSLGYPVWWLEAGNYKDGPPPVETSSLQKRLMAAEQAAGAKEKKRVDEDTHLDKGWNERVQSVPGLSLTHSAEDGVASLWQCVQSCSSAVEDSQYRRCSQACVGNHAQ